MFALAVTDAFMPRLDSAVIAPLFATAFTVLALDVLRRTQSRRLAAGTGILISLVISMSFVLSLVAAPEALSAFLCLIAGTLLVLAGLATRGRTILFAGAMTMTASVVFGFEPLLQLVVNSSWIDLAIFGACAIALGSVLDRHGVAVNMRLADWFGTPKARDQEIALDD